MIARSLAIATLFALTAVTARSQPGSIVADANAVKLRLFWSQQGAQHHDWFGVSIFPVHDIDGDSINEFLVSSILPRTTVLYHGDPVRPRLDTTWSFDSTDASEAFEGDFFGDGRRMLVLRRRFQIYVLEIDSGRISKQPVAIWSPLRKDKPELSGSRSQIAVADLDRDGADELLVIVGFVDGDPKRMDSQIWIYQGGPGFQVDSPSVVLRDGLENDRGVRAGVADIDGDSHIDIFTTERDILQRTVLNIWFGTGEMPVTGQPPDRALPTSLFTWQLVDADGDAVSDILDDQFLYLSGRGKNARTRTFAADDFDFLVSSTPYFAYNFGPLNNRPGRFDMVGPAAYEDANGGVFHAYSGGPRGPDATVDAVLYVRDYGFLGGIAGGTGSGPVGDLTGDGWSDFLCSNPHYYDPGVDKGIVAIIAGGPYIPVDDPSMAVRQISTGNQVNAISLWPNPARESLHIAWRGDLREIPTLFDVFNSRGELIAHGDIDPSIGSALWNCRNVSRGVYVLRVRTQSGDVIASIPFTKY